MTPASERPPDPLAFRHRFAVAAFHEGGLLIDMTTGAYFQLDANAAKISSALVATDTYEAAVQRLCDDSGFDVAGAQGAIRNVLADLTAPAPSRMPDGPIRYKQNLDGTGYTLAQGDIPILHVDRNGDELRLTADSSSLRLLDCIRSVTPKILALQGLTVLHASAVSIDGQITAFSGLSGAGKTTTAVALARAGAQLVSEDLVILNLTAGGVHVAKDGESGIRHWQVSAERYWQNSPDKPLPCHELRRLFDGSEQPLNEVVFLSAARRSGDRIERRLLPRPDALRLLVENNFLGSADGPAWRQHLHSAFHIAQVVPTSTATVPKGVDRLNDAARRYTATTAS